MKAVDVRLRIEQDDDPTSPREHDNLGIMVCFHKRYNLGDKTELKSEMFDGWDELRQHLVDEEGALHVLPLYLYDHSGITMNTTGFSCGFDSSQVGFIYTTRKLLDDTGVADDVAEEQLKGEVGVYDQYLTGDVWSYTVYVVHTCDMGHEHEEILDSCCGFYGQDAAEQEGEAAKEILLRDAA